MSRFISAGTEIDGPASSTDANADADKVTPTPTTREATTTTSASEEAWRAAQRQIDATRSIGATGGGGAALGSQEGGKSLFETLQANKAAKQAAHEEALRLSNQFRALDEDEVAFLEGVDASARAREAAERKEAGEQLEAFRKLQQDVEAQSREGGVGDGRETAAAADGTGVDSLGLVWSVGPRKRKKGPGEGKGGVAGVKVRRTSSNAAPTAAPTTTGSGQAETSERSKVPPTLTDQTSQQGGSTLGTSSAPKVDSKPPTESKEGSNEPERPESTSPPPAALGLAAYSSDED